MQKQSAAKVWDPIRLQPLRLRVTWKLRKTFLNALKHDENTPSVSAEIGACSQRLSWRENIPCAHFELDILSAESVSG